MSNGVVSKMMVAQALFEKARDVLKEARDESAEIEAKRRLYGTPLRPPRLISSSVDQYLESWCHDADVIQDQLKGETRMLVKILGVKALR